MNATADQIHFIGLVTDFLTRNGAMDSSQIFDPPFIDNAPQGPTQVFEMDQVSRLIEAIERITSSADAESA